MSKTNLIFKINQLVRAIEGRTGLDELDFSSRAILKFIGDAYADGVDLSVSDIAKSGQFGTPPTVYSKLTTLEQAGWIETWTNSDDARVKNIGLSSQAVKVFSAMSAAVLKVYVN